MLSIFAKQRGKLQETVTDVKREEIKEITICNAL